MAVQYQGGGARADGISGGTSAAIAASVEAGVRSGALPADAALPPVRRLAADLGVTAVTVAAAYRTLRDRGVIETACRHGTRVRARPPVSPAEPLTGAGTRRSDRPAVPAGVRDLSRGEPDVSLLPRLRDALARVAVDPAPANYSGGGPLPELLDLAAARLAAKGVPVPALTVVSGALDAIERVLGAHLRTGDRVGVEDPGWANLIDLVAALGLVAVPIPVDAEGPTVDGVTRALDAGVAAVIVTARAQNPTGGAVSPARAAALRPAFAARPDVLLIEDDHSGDLDDLPLAPLAGAGRRWAFVESVSKAYGPDLRVAVVAGDETTIARVEGRLRLGAGWVSTLLQRVVLDLWRDGDVRSLIAAAGPEYARRRDALVAALAARGIAVSSRSGFNVWVPVPDETVAVTALRDAGWAVAPGSRFRLASPPGIRISASALAPDECPALAEIIASRGPVPLAR
ncbi:aminotransferase class I/II-fold pyridoxal phosphate-dependent enzyme [Luedemannella helvata]|uniref:Aminotransferase class I/II-fold pyridoxal phosphate-dependent enzyme n=1 Tax=Luedemannella helvata TaxID=349315 RepID=A0ABN2KMM9_9ACTN